MTATPDPRPEEVPPPLDDVDLDQMGETLDDDGTPGAPPIEDPEDAD